MKQLFIYRNNHPRLCLLFAGWGMDEHPFAHHRPADADLMVCYDYRTLDFDESQLKAYQEIHLVGWSMGVWAASQVMQHTSLPITRSTAINGTPSPIDPQRGIAPAIFTATLQGLNEATLQKFRLRMCGTATAYKAFMEVAPQRSIEELREELATIGQQSQTLTPARFVWQEARIGNADRIFLPENQQRAWQETTTVITHTEEPHYADHLFTHIA